MKNGELCHAAKEAAKAMQGNQNDLAAKRLIYLLLTNSRPYQKCSVARHFVSKRDFDAF